MFHRKYYQDANAAVLLLLLWYSTWACYDAKHHELLIARTIIWLMTPLTDSVLMMDTDATDGYPPVLLLDFDTCIYREVYQEMCIVLIHDIRERNLPWYCTPRFWYRGYQALLSYCCCTLRCRMLLFDFDTEVTREKITLWYSYSGSLLHTADSFLHTRGGCGPRDAKNKSHDADQIASFLMCLLTFVATSVT